MSKIALSLMAISLAGCVAIKYEPVKVDSPAPVDAAEVGKCPPTLEVKKRCIARIQADQWTSWTGIKIAKEGERYWVTVLPDQVWFDKDRRNIPPFGEEGSGIMQLAERRHLKVPFFSLMVDVVPDDNEKLTVQNTAVVVAYPKKFPFTAKSLGKLVLYPNDVKGPVSAPAYWYENNSGHIWVTIERRAAP